MSRENPNSQAAQIRKAERVLRGLLRTPKTRSGLIAAVVGSSLSRNFVYGWLGEQVRVGEVVVMKSSRNLTYQIATAVVAETPDTGSFPTWLEPRVLPVAGSRDTYIGGKLVSSRKSK